MKILSVIQSVDPAFGGPAEGLRQLIPEYLKNGLEYEVVSLDEPNSAFLKDFPTKITALGKGNGTFGFSPKLVPWLTEKVENVDIAIVHGLWQYHGPAVRKVFHGRKPYVVFCHGMLDPWFNKAYPLKFVKKWFYWQLVQYRTLAQATRVLFTTEEEMVLAKQSFWPYKVNGTVVAYGTRLPAIDLEECKKEFLDQFPDLNGKRVLLFLSRIHQKKGIDLLLEGFAKIASTDPLLRLVVAGPDPQNLTSGYRQDCVQLGIDSRVLWPGMLRGNLKWGAFTAASGFVLPSHQENFGIAVAEALAAGTPVVTTNKVNIWREIERYEAGTVVDDTADGVTLGLEKFLKLDESEIQKMKGNARRCFLESFEIEAAAKSIANALSMAVNDFRKSH